MHESYFVEERSGAFGIAPLTQSPQLYYRRNKIDWGSISAWIHLSICLVSIPIIIWNLYLLSFTIIDYSSPIVSPSGEPKLPHPLAFLIVISAVLMNLMGGFFALITESCCLSEKAAKFVYVMVYLSLAISTFALVFSNNLLGVIGLVLLLLFMVSFGFGFWRFSLISSIYLNEEGPVWFKPLLYGCLAAIPLLTTSSQCLDAKNPYGCLPNEWFAGRIMFSDFLSFSLMTIVAVMSSIPYLVGISHN